MNLLRRCEVKKLLRKIGWKDCRSEKANRQSSEVISNFGKEWNGEKKPLFIGNRGGTKETQSLGFPKALSPLINEGAVHLTIDRIDPTLKLPAPVSPSPSHIYTVVTCPCHVPCSTRASASGSDDLGRPRPRSSRSLGGLVRMVISAHGVPPEVPPRQDLLVWNPPHYHFG